MEGISTAVETSFFGKEETIAAMVPYVDTFYVDLKAVTPSLHKKYCGVDNRIILHNIKFLDRQKGGFQMILGPLSFLESTIRRKNSTRLAHSAKILTDWSICGFYRITHWGV